jgi:hypothetical protein
MMEQEQGLEEQEFDPQVQSSYEDLYHQMNMIIDQPEVFNSTRKMLADAQQAGMLVPQASQAVVHILNRLEKEVGPIDEAVLRALAEDLVTGVSDRFGLEVTEDEEGQIAAAAVGLWMKEHKDRIDIPPEDMALMQEEFAAMEQEVGQPPGQPQAPQSPAPQATGLLGGA